MHAENLVVLRLAHDLHKAFFLTENARLSGCGKRKLADLNVIARLARLGFRQTYRGDFGIAVSAIGYQPQVDGPDVLLSSHVLNSDDTFFRSKVGQQRRRHDVADCIDTFFTRLLVLVHLHEALFKFDLSAFKTKPLGIGHAADRH